MPNDRMVANSHDGSALPADARRGPGLTGSERPIYRLYSGKKEKEDRWHMRDVDTRFILRWRQAGGHLGRLSGKTA